MARPTRVNASNNEWYAASEFLKGTARSRNSMLGRIGTLDPDREMTKIAGLHLPFIDDQPTAEMDAFSEFVGGEKTHVGLRTPQNQQVLTIHGSPAGLQPLSNETSRTRALFQHPGVLVGEELVNKKEAAYLNSCFGGTFPEFALKNTDPALTKRYLTARLPRTFNTPLPLQMAGFGLPSMEIPVATLSMPNNRYLKATAKAIRRNEEKVIRQTAGRRFLKPDLLSETLGGRNPEAKVSINRMLSRGRPSQYRETLDLVKHEFRSQPDILKELMSTIGRTNISDRELARKVASRLPNIVLHRNLESGLGQYFKKLFQMPYHFKSTADPLAAALFGEGAIDTINNIQTDPEIIRRALMADGQPMPDAATLKTLFGVEDLTQLEKSSINIKGIGNIDYFLFDDKSNPALSFPEVSTNSNAILIERSFAKKYPEHIEALVGHEVGEAVGWRKILSRIPNKRDQMYAFIDANAMMGMKPFGFSKRFNSRVPHLLGIEIEAGVSTDIRKFYLDMTTGAHGATLQKSVKGIRNIIKENKALIRKAKDSPEKIGRLEGANDYYSSMLEDIKTQLKLFKNLKGEEAQNYLLEEGVSKAEGGLLRQMRYTAGSGPLSKIIQWTNRNPDKARELHAIHGNKNFRRAVLAEIGKPTLQNAAGNMKRSATEVAESVIKREGENKIDQVLESAAGSFFKNLFHMPFKPHSTTDVIAAATEKYQTGIEAIKHPVQNIVPFTAIAIMAGMQGYSGYTAYKAATGDLTNKLAAAYSGAVSTTIGARYFAALGSGVVSLATGRSWEQKLGGMAYAITDPLTDRLVSAGVGRAMQSQPIRAGAAKVLNSLYRMVDSKPTLMSKPAIANLAQDWHRVAEGLLEETVDQEIITSLKQTGKLGLTPLLSIPVYFALGAGLKAIGRAVDHIHHGVKHQAKPEATTHVSEVSEPANPNTMNLNMNVNFNDIDISRSRKDEIYSNTYKRGVAY
jgi:hypothetical protein